MNAPTTELTLAKALNAGLRAAMEADDSVLLMGEDIGTLGGVFRVTDGLAKDFGSDRVIDTPLAESGIVGTAVGLALAGYRPVVEIQFDGFVYPAFDQIVSQVARMRYRSGGRLAMPMVIRIPFGGGIGAVEHHSESPEALFAHIPGLKVVACSGAADASWMIQAAIAADDPVVFFEPKALYHAGTEPARDADSALFSSVIRRRGTDATIVGYGPTVGLALATAEAAEAESGRSVEVIDLRSISPLDLDPVFDSVRRTGRLVVIHQAPGECGVGAEVAARVSQECFYSLTAPVLRVTGWDVPYPPARVEHDHLPDVDRVLDAIDAAVAW